MLERCAIPKAYRSAALDPSSPGVGWHLSHSLQRENEGFSCELVALVATTDRRQDEERPRGSKEKASPGCTGCGRETKGFPCPREGS